MFTLAPRTFYRPRTNGRVPFGLASALLSDWSLTDEEAPRVARPRFDVTEDDANYQVRAELPGVSREDISVDVEGSRVSLRAKASHAQERKDGAKVIYSERRHESFARDFELPQEVNGEAAVAQFENGVLTLTLPKRDARKSTRVSIG